ncbi:MAG TPA: PDZ domain-containing protein [Caulobacteraceae bacterium]|jgi:hypothetical protein
MKILLCAALTVICLFAPSLTLADARASVELANKTLYIRVVVARRPLWFVLDTGDKYAVIDLPTAQKLGVALGDPIPIGGGGDKTVMGALVKGTSFTVPEVGNFSQPLFIAAPLGDLAKISGHEFAGVLGYDFISQFIVEINYASQTVTLHDKDTYHYDRGGESFPITFNTSGHPMVHGEVVDDDGRTATGDFVLDIGNGAALILNTPFVDAQHYLQSGRRTLPWIEGRAFGGGVDGVVGRVRAFRLGRFEIARPLTVFARTVQGPFGAADQQGNIGAAILEKFRVVIDYPHNRIYLEPNAQFSAPIPYNRTGLSLTSSGDDFRTFLVDAVADASPASEAGLQKGDILVAIDGKPAMDFTLSALREDLQHMQQAILTIRRGDRTIETTIRPRDLV